MGGVARFWSHLSCAPILAPFRERGTTFISTPAVPRSSRPLKRPCVPHPSCKAVNPSRVTLPRAGTAIEPIADSLRPPLHPTVSPRACARRLRSTVDVTGPEAAAHGPAVPVSITPR